VPEFKALQMPPRSAKGAAFLASATAMANAATTHKDALLERGLPADSLDQFQASLTTLASSLSDREQNHTRRMGATKGLAFEEQEGRSVLKVLDALMQRALRGNEALLATWEGARTIRRRPGGAPTTSSTTPATPAATPASSPTAPAAAAA
jgi:cob(I)alamin adenosyltransferase